MRKVNEMMTADEQSYNGIRQVSRRNRRIIGTGRQITLALASLILMLPGAYAQNPVVPSSGLRYTSKGEIVVPMVFPVLGGARWSDTYGKTRSGGTRKQQGQDLPAPKMHPLIACFDGIWTGEGIRGDNGCFASYGSINNDTPGTDDGLAKEEYSYAPGVWPGARGRAGQHVAYCGDSGDAEALRPQLHFELSIPNRGTINPAASLRAAAILQKPAYTLVRPEVKPDSSQLRLDGEVASVDTVRGVAAIRVAAWIKTNKVTTQTRPAQRWIKLVTPAVRNQLSKIEKGDFVAIVGKDPGNGQPVLAEAILPLQINKTARQAHATSQKTALRTAKNVTVELIPDEPEYVPPPVPQLPRVTILADVESGYYQGWEVIGNCWGRTIESAAIAGSTVRGWGGLYFLTTARAMPGSKNLSSGTGRARSAPFFIPPDATEIRFLIAGGNYPDRCCLNLIDGDQVLRTATGQNPFKMQTAIWDITDLRGRTVQLEVRDSMSVGVHAYIHVDDIVLLQGSTDIMPKDVPYVKNSPGVTPLPETAPLPDTIALPSKRPYRGNRPSSPDGGV